MFNNPYSPTPEILPSQGGSSRIPATFSLPFHCPSFAEKLGQQSDVGPYIPHWQEKRAGQQFVQPLQMR
jgi:hypothetical protein